MHRQNGLFLRSVVPRAVRTGDGTDFAPRLQKCDPSDDEEELASQDSTTLFFPSHFWGEKTHLEIRQEQLAQQYEAQGGVRYLQRDLEPAELMPQAVFVKDSVMFLSSLIHPVASCESDWVQPFSWLVCHGCGLVTTLQGAVYCCHL